jgi:glycine/D-amino acid oxidase-like deaminating enzyme
MAAQPMTEFAHYTAEKYRGPTLDGQWCYRQVGVLEVATGPERLAEIQRRHGWLSSWGVYSRLLSPEESAELHPLLDPEQILGGFHIPSDGLAKALRASEAQARLAMARGARFLGTTR